MLVHSTGIVPYGNAVMELFLGIELAILPLHCALYSGAGWLELTNKFKSLYGNILLKLFRRAV